MRRDSRGRGPGAIGWRRARRAIRSAPGRLDITSSSRRGATRRAAASPSPTCSSGPIRRFPTVPAASPSSSARRTEVDLVVFSPGTAPDSVEVFDYEEPTTAGQHLLFSVQPVPIEQGTAKELAYARGARVVTWLMLIAVICAFTLAAGPLERITILALVVWLAVRAPIGSRARGRSRSSLPPRFSVRSSDRCRAPPACSRSPARCS